MTWLEFFALLYGLPIASFTIIAVVAFGCAAGTTQAEIEATSGKPKKPQPSGQADPNAPDYSPFD